MSETSSQDCIQTKIQIPSSEVVKWLRSRFDSLGADARMIATSNWSGDTTFTIQHTVQAVVNHEPITLRPVVKVEQIEGGES